MVDFSNDKDKARRDIDELIGPLTKVQPTSAQMAR